MSIVSSKSCTRCSEMKPLTDYYKHTRTKDGRQSRCKTCQIITVSEKHAENKEAVSAWHRAYRERNKEARNAYSREYREKNKEALNARSREYAKNNRDKHNEANRRRKARRAGNGFEKYTEVEALELYGIDCHLCMEPIDMDAPRNCRGEGWERGLHFDHVISLSNGGPDNLENIRPSHAVCNLRKNRN
jgi:hypothetical protein